MAKFLTGVELTEEVSDIIFQAKKQLLIVSPYIKLDSYFKDGLFIKHKGNSELHLIIAFGKNVNNPNRSLTNEDLDYFKEFPNVSIIYVPNLHAKYYANERKGVITSINLYDYSFKKNVEFGVVSETRFIGGSGIDKEAWEQTMSVLKDNYTVFIRRPNYKRKILGKDYLGSETRLDLTETLLSGNLPDKRCVFDFDSESFVNIETNNTRISREDFEKQNNPNKTFHQEIKVREKLLSATSLGKSKGKTFDEVIKVMKTHDYIFSKDQITQNGKLRGIRYKTNAKGEKWIVYPESLKELLK
jgi:hypothetical protein